MTVHYRHYKFVGAPAEVAPCGYVYDKRLRGLDFNCSWDERAPVPVNCTACLQHRPSRRKVLPWHADAQKR